ncbi:YqjF family protein [Actinospongicola halichondriae]|uniref:YqjF family protein n=1 Tax=Actinospongicola halichondriae TaxID=3236844 RepID=UPI003D572F78
MTAWVERLLDDPALAKWAPDRPWSAAQREQHVLFLHYPVPVEQLRSAVPDSLEIQVVDGTAWISVIALEVADVTARRFPVPPWLRRFGEVDLLVPVVHEGRRGVFFLAIEGAQRIASMITRWTIGLPYLYAGTRTRQMRDGWQVTSGPRWCADAPAASFDATYRPLGPVEHNPDSPASWLADQYSMYVVDRRGRLCRGDEIHGMWPLRAAEVDLRMNTLPAAAGLTVPDRPALVHYSEGRDIVTWTPTPV